MNVGNLGPFAMGFSTCAAIASLMQGKLVLMAANLALVALNYAVYRFVHSGNSK